MIIGLLAVAATVLGAPCTTVSANCTLLVASGKTVVVSRFEEPTEAVFASWLKFQLRSSTTRRKPGSPPRCCTSRKLIRRCAPLPFDER
jgi:hypothetical protein